jgi:hypothetical protein
VVQIQIPCLSHGGIISIGITSHSIVPFCNKCVGLAVRPYLLPSLSPLSHVDTNDSDTSPAILSNGRIFDCMQIVYQFSEAKSKIMENDELALGHALTRSETVRALGGRFRSF